MPSVEEWTKAQNNPDLVTRSQPAPEATPQPPSTPTPEGGYVPGARVFPSDVLSFEKRKLIELSGEIDELKERVRALETQIERLLLKES